MERKEGEAPPTGDIGQRTQMQGLKICPNMLLVKFFNKNVLVTVGFLIFCCVFYYRGGGMYKIEMRNEKIEMMRYVKWKDDNKKMVRC